MKFPTVAFTGHRPEKLGGYGPSETQTRVRVMIRDFLERCAPTTVISGMALGVDQWAAEEAMRLGMPVTAAVPFAGQERLWPEQSQMHFRELLSKCAKVEIISPGGYEKRKMQVRNAWMVNNCDLLCCVWDLSDGGTANCVKYAEKVGKKIHWIPVLDTGYVIDTLSKPGDESGNPRAERPKTKESNE